MCSGIRQRSPSCLLIYDGNCRLCMMVKKKLEQGNLQGDVKFIAYQTEEAAQLLGKEYHLGIPAMAYRVNQDGTINYGLEAVLPFLSDHRWGKTVHFFWRIWIFRYLAIKAYAVVARYRYRWFGAVTSD